eukprot:TRINITY_DN510_c0_g1_i1.p1 TRINITY_DN510_c0_g1~~TRINITY_DN510_c0_g1_i1.p1  ORF type:complete len:391 (+),score=140.72 TRINITY_DN510_c0_g1_i1:46-1218(+)
MTGSATDLGLTFIQKYYHSMSLTPSNLASMYSTTSEMVTETGDSVKGVEDIKHVLNNKSLQERKFRITGLASYPSIHDSVLVLVRGTMLTKEESQNFVQTFVLGRSKSDSTTYFIRNDILEFRGVEEQCEAAAPAPIEEPVPEPEPEPVYEPEPEPEPEYVAPAPVVEKEPTPEPVVEEPKEEKPATPVPTPPTKPVEAPKPVTPKPEPVAVSGWAGIVASSATASSGPRKVQVCSGGEVPGIVKAMTKAERDEKKDKKRGVSPSKGGKRGSSPQRFPKSFSIFVSNVGKDTTKTEIEKLFGKFGKLTGAPTVNAERAYAFVDFAEKKSMEDSIEASNNDKVTLADGRILKCQERTSPEKRQQSKDATNATRGRTGDKPRGMNGAPASRK